MTQPATARKRKRHPALAGRVMATGISTAALFGGVAGLAHEGGRGQGKALPLPGPTIPSTTLPVSSPPAPVPVTPETVVVVREIHRTVYVDENGNPLGPPAAPAAAPAAPPAAGHAPVRRSSGPAAGPAAPPAPAPAVAAPPPPPPPPPPVAKPSPPTCSGSKCP